MPAVKYIGPHDLVDIPDLNIFALPHGQKIDVSDEVAANLLLQDVWEAVPTKPVKES